MDNIFQSDIVKNANEELKAISDSLTVHSVGSSDEKIYSLSTSIPLKGNKDIIHSLEKLGWEKTRRFKVKTDGNWTRNQDDGYEMHQGMIKYFRQLN